MKIQIVGNGQFGTFLWNLLKDTFEIVKQADVVVLAVPISAYDEIGLKYASKNLVNMCSVQSNSHETLLKYSDNVLSIHPLFGVRTPEEKRTSIVTSYDKSDWQVEFLNTFSRVSKLVYDIGLTEHDEMMARTHLAGLEVYDMIKDKVSLADDISDDYIPQSFRMLREFVSMIANMPPGTVESIRSNTTNK